MWFSWLYGITAKCIAWNGFIYAHLATVMPKWKKSNLIHAQMFSTACICKDAIVYSKLMSISRNFLWSIYVDKWKYPYHTEQLPDISAMDCLEQRRDWLNYLMTFTCIFITILCTGLTQDKQAYLGIFSSILVQNILFLPFELRRTATGKQMALSRFAVLS